MDEPTKVTRRGFLLTLGILPFAAPVLAEALMGATGVAADPSLSAMLAEYVPLPGITLHNFAAVGERLVRARLEVGAPRGLVWVDVDVPIGRTGKASVATLHRALASARFHLAQKARLAGGADVELVKSIAGYDPGRIETAWDLNRAVYFQLLPVASPKRRVRGSDEYVGVIDSFPSKRMRDDL